MSNQSGGPVRGHTFFCILAFSLCVFAPAALLAQPIDSEKGEVSAFGGGSFGLGVHPVVGGGTGLAFSKYGIGLIEASYMPTGRDTLRRNVVSPQNSQVFDFNSSIHIRIPVRERWAPYGIVGCGLLFNKFQAVSGPQGTLVGIDDFKFAFHTGAGVRYYIREGWGIRPEFKVIVSNRTYTRFTIGIFYTIPSDWP
jgi:hypothetical protein